MSPGEPLIQFKKVKKAFGQKVIYSGLDLDVRAGESLTIIGGSGVGKSAGTGGQSTNPYKGRLKQKHARN